MSSPAAEPTLPAGYSLLTFDDIDSTNAEALRAGTPHGLVLRANRQSAGRGRRDRVWQSLDGNLFATVCVQPPGNRFAGQLAFVAGLAVLDCLSEMSPRTSFGLKWPNDILAQGRKLAGILIEAGDNDGFAVGIGINLVSAPTGPEIRFPATDLRSVADVLVDPGAVIGPLCGHFDRWYRQWTEHGFEPLRAVWLASAHGIGDTIAASTGAGRIEGRFEGLDADGALILEDAHGDRHVIAAGDVFFPATD